jgi:threonine/homoserine/homoserine lactone efflux protein
MIPPLPLLLGFILASITLIAIPGPSVMFEIGRTLSHGRKAGLITVVFNVLGTTVWLIAVVVGLGAFLATNPAALAAIRIAGAIYLGYLGVQSIRHRKLDEAKLQEKEQAAGSDKQDLSGRRIARDAFIVGASNPKVAIFFSAVLPQFISSDGNFTAQFIFLGLLFQVLAYFGDGSYVMLASVARDWIFSRSGRLAAIIGTGGVLITGLAIYLVVSTLLELGH